MNSDPIADLLARLRNAALARHELARIPASRLKVAVAELLKAEGYVSDVRREEWGPKKAPTLTITLKYGRDRNLRFPRHATSFAPGATCVHRSRLYTSSPERPRGVNPEHFSRRNDGQGGSAAKNRR